MRAEDLDYEELLESYGLMDVRRVRRTSVAAHCKRLATRRAAKGRPWPATCSPPCMNAKYLWAMATGLSTTLIAAPAFARPTDRIALCPVWAGPTPHVTPACSAVDLFSNRGYLVVPGTHVHMGVTMQHVNLVFRIALF